jgi:hypothetical protein
MVCWEVDVLGPIIVMVEDRKNRFDPTVSFESTHLLGCRQADQWFPKCLGNQYGRMSKIDTGNVINDLF